jgi:hypothetical protein
VSPVKYELGFYIPEDDILHSHRQEKRRIFVGLCIWSSALWAIRVHTLVSTETRAHRTAYKTRAVCGTVGTRQEVNRAVMRHEPTSPGRMRPHSTYLVSGCV